MFHGWKLIPKILTEEADRQQCMHVLGEHEGQGQQAGGVAAGQVRVGGWATQGQETAISIFLEFLTVYTACSSCFD